MTEAQTILKMIEDVSPDDTDTLDEIDARVETLVDGVETKQEWDTQSGNPATRKIWLRTSPTIIGRFLVKRYTRSRDALKSIRPKGWHWEAGRIYSADIYLRSRGWAEGFWCSLYSVLPPSIKYKTDQCAGPTEELAELHAIIQAIEWERKNDETL